MFPKDVDSRQTPNNTAVRSIKETWTLTSEGGPGTQPLNPTSEPDF